MKPLVVIVAVFMCLSCASLPKLDPAGGAFDCPAPFLTEKTRLIHAIEARVAGRVSSVIGVTLADPAERAMSVAIVGTEGLSLFEADSKNGEIAVKRALPPFDQHDFARGMMSDIELIFFAPQPVHRHQGLDEAGCRVCRYAAPKEGFTDVSEVEDGVYRIRRYSPGMALKREVTIRGDRGERFAQIDLQAYERVRYRLIMTLLEAETVSGAATK
ncbi:MAG TPA: hypothetical protein PK090_08440 [Smithellaceae bacterium]|nr:hypothetical protein [Smithellaceae bacterium]